ncbi:hypothetical protein HBI56_176490 [Parastagonospora nodorum]|nr:hypothetical protein HBH56_237630 [Parastagonospora nodorum]KAH3924362.1 hypothetical protein HBH54_197850 [Parastagonospora nodorum]KAH3942497.1 hypothetical protein HBH53_185640 [Parastagonospora nodorum]KAH3961675.1 hypothetical protein HBH51_180880 [Parastagonospora nodorum]KAH3968542.1 hypothetical protein HBH52_180290 [Parastagonospora nodorum]
MDDKFMFFNALHKRQQNPKLHALAIGSYIRNRKEERADMGVPGGFKYFSQHCFVRGMQTDMLGRTIAVVLPVTRAILQAAEPLADILDYDSECSLSSAAIGTLSIQ